MFRMAMHALLPCLLLGSVLVKLTNIVISAGRRTAFLSVTQSFNTHSWMLIASIWCDRPSIAIFFLSFSRLVQPEPQRHCWCRSTTSADDCCTSNSSSFVSACFGWADSSEPVESATAGAASAYTQTGTYPQTVVQSSAMTFRRRFKLNDFPLQITGCLDQQFRQIYHIAFSFFFPKCRNKSRQLSLWQWNSKPRSCWWKLSWTSRNLTIYCSRSSTPAPKMPSP